MKAYMITMVGREDSAARTAAEFEQHGIEVIQFVQPADWPIGKQGNNWNSKRAIEAAIEDGQDFLFIEDDLFLNHDRFTRCLTDLESDPELTYLYIHESAYWMSGIYEKRDVDGSMKELHNIFNFNQADWREKAKRVVVPEGFRVLQHHQVFGSQCVFIPAKYLSMLYEEHVRKHHYSSSVFSVNNEAFDTTLTVAVPKYGIPVRTWLPHPVQHTQNRVNRVGKRSDVYSRTFHATSDKELWSEVV